MKINKAVVLLTALAPAIASALTPGETRREIALELAGKSEVLAYSLADNNYKLDLAAIAKAVPNNKKLNKLSHQANKSTISKYGVQGYAKSVMQVRLVTPKMTDMDADNEVLISYVPDGDESEWSAIEAFDQQGNTVYLDVYNQPSQPVVVIGTDDKKIQKAGIRLLNDRLSGASPKGMQRSRKSDNTETLNTSILKKINLTSDQEPWILGKAEIYAIVTGVSAERDKPQIDIVDMPYLDEDGKDYHPNQVLVYWERYRWGVADILFFEQDSDYNYKELAKLLLEIVGKGLELGGIPEAKPFIGIGQRVLSAMKDSWFQNDDDYVDSFYVLENSRTYNSYVGANSNATISLQPRQFTAF
ncbi:DUF3103 family protein [Endozoicomonas sp. SM1973]|uniref:DUF3103 family protein n=1 Tax=Spartinivicinus marinus TaxID=2994442 RepID=A0A853IJI8_9GAMM|nr:DUF3103 family protein [Spartinivicinus marinus]MCX4027712.1 DUF3103 family protein [Spartinivicinus marinus]NYZ69245.1 DUF3103 family protein [Spartinivicinus marinus]